MVHESLLPQQETTGPGNSGPAVNRNWWRALAFSRHHHSATVLAAGKVGVSPSSPCSRYALRVAPGGCAPFPSPSLRAMAERRCRDEERHCFARKCGGSPRTPCRTKSWGSGSALGQIEVYAVVGGHPPPDAAILRDGAFPTIGRQRQWRMSSDRLRHHFRLWRR